MIVGQCADHAAQRTIGAEARELLARGELRRALALAWTGDERFTDTGLAALRRQLDEALRRPERLAATLRRLRVRMPPRYPRHFRPLRPAAARGALPRLRVEFEALLRENTRVLADGPLEADGRVAVERLQQEARAGHEAVVRMEARSAAGFRWVLGETGLLLLGTVAVAVAMITPSTQAPAGAEPSAALAEQDAGAFASYRRGQEALARQDFAGADRELTQAVRQKADYAKAMVLLAETKSREGDQPLAVSCATRAILNDPADVQARLVRGHARFALRYYEGALTDYTRAISLDPGSADAAVYNNLGTIRLALYDASGAVKDFTSAIARAPAEPRAYLNRGRTKFGQRDYAGAAADFSQAINLSPAAPDAYFRRGETRYAQGDIAGATADFSAAISRGSQEAEVYYARGRLEYGQDKYADAIVDYDSAIRLNPGYTQAYSARSEAKWQKSRFFGGDDGTGDKQLAQQLERLGSKPAAGTGAH
ncbi:MAG: tetratricopeptide repeat protein [Opitutales bacterium]